MKGAHDEEAVAMNFSWIEEKRVAGCRGPRTKEDLRFLCSSGVRSLVRLAHEDEIGISPADVSGSGLEDFYEPVEDCSAPSQLQVSRIVQFINDSVRRGKPTVVSCNAGCGRTGTILACYLVSQGNSADDGIQKVIRKRPCSSEILRVPGQKEAVHDFATALNKR
jgi:atypical dual specificity phosphatase